MSIYFNFYVVYCRGLWYNMERRRCAMYLRKSMSNGRIYLSFVQGYRKDGKVKQRTVEKLGYLDDLEKIYPDPIEHFRQIARDRSKEDTAPKSLEVDTSARLPDQARLRKNLGYAVPKKIAALLHMKEFFQNKQRRLKVDFKLDQIFSLLVYNRFLFPASKKSAFESRDMFFDPCDFSLNDVYRALPLFQKYSHELQRHLRQQVQELIGMPGQLGYYDVTNYFFEIPYEDEDPCDETGAPAGKGMRKRGPSKEHRKDPIVQMGLLMDENGIPMSFNLFPGNVSEKTSLRPAIRQAKKDFGLERIVVVADRGLNTSDNTALLSGRNDDDAQGYDGYIYGQSVLGADKEFKEWVLNQDGYEVSMEKDPHGDEVQFRYKSRIYAKKVQLKNTEGKRKLSTEIYQKQMVYYSSKYAKKQRTDRERVLAKARDLIAHPGKYTRATSIGAAGYVRNIHFVKNTGEIPDGLELLLDEERIREEEKYDGYYAIVTSEKHLTPQQMRAAYKGLWEIEESFKVIKSEFRARPVYLHKEEHIEAHFLICFTALVLMRVLELLMKKTHTIKQILHALRSYSCSYLEQNYYLFDYRDDVLIRLEEVLHMDLSKRIMSLSEIKKISQYKL